MRRAIWILAYVALGLLLAGCSVIPFLYVNNETDDQVTILVDWGEGSTSFIVGPNKWTERDLPFECLRADDVTVSVYGVSQSGNEVADVFGDENTSWPPAAFVRLDSSGLHKANVPFWYHIREKGPIYLILLCLIAVIVIPAFIIGRAIRRRKSARSENRTASVG